MGKNQAYKAMQRARLGSSSAGPEEIEDGMYACALSDSYWAGFIVLKVLYAILYCTYDTEDMCYLRVFPTLPLKGPRFEHSSKKYSMPCFFWKVGQVFIFTSLREQVVFFGVFAWDAAWEEIFMSDQLTNRVDHQSRNFCYVSMLFLWEELKRDYSSLSMLVYLEKEK
ncbi:hypothetical protein CK203_086435 [Vitis vinifera]|uniref:Uncharacterized protein n=1 Tax=Vitis vinifera TaxID=29760 RepID=A0A438BST3_VITVI|nr:hypothetical protein CK203_086435 [Vitis vinifera]